MAHLTAQRLAELFSAKIFCPPSCAISADMALKGFAPLENAAPGEISFLSGPQYEKYLATTKASVVIVRQENPSCTSLQLVHKNPYWCYAKGQALFMSKTAHQPGISEKAHIGAQVEIGTGVTIMPFAYIGERCKIADGVVIFPGVYVGSDSTIGKDSEIRANVSIDHGTTIGERVLIHAGCCIGGDGFGFAPGDQDIAKIPQVGVVRIGDDVEIGTGTTIDRATMGETHIGRGTKIDSAVHIAHNVEIGEHTMICGAVAIAGSSKIGKWVILAGRAMVEDHMVVGDRIIIGGAAGVTKNITEPGLYLGFPAQPAAKWRREVAATRRLAHLEKRVRELEAKAKA